MSPDLFLFTKEINYKILKETGFYLVVNGGPCKTLFFSRILNFEHLKKIFDEDHQVYLLTLREKCPYWEFS